MARRMSFSDAMDMVPDDLPDGAFFAMAHEMAGLDYGDGFAELAEEEFGTGSAKPRISKNKGGNPQQAHKHWLCHDCKRRFRNLQGAEQHWRDVHGEVR